VANWGVSSLLYILKVRDIAVFSFHNQGPVGDDTCLDVSDAAGSTTWWLWMK